MDLSLSRPVQVTLPGTSGSAYVVPSAPITPTGSSGMLTPSCSPPASPSMPPSPSPAGSSSDSSVSSADGQSSSSSSAASSSASASLPSRPVAEFLFHLTRMLTDPSIRNLIEWTPQGSIRVHDPHTLENEVLGKYFRHSKYSSFQRQLNYFGFRKVGSKGRMSPCSYINDDTGDDLSSLLSIKRKTANRARSRKAQAEKEAAKQQTSASVSDIDSCSEDAEAEEATKKALTVQKEKKEKKEGGSKKRKKSSSSSSGGSSESGSSPSKKSKKKKKRSSSSSSGSSSSSSSTTTSIAPKASDPIKEEEKEPAPLAPAAIAVTDIDFGPPGSIDFRAMASVSLTSPSTTPAPPAPAPQLITPAASAASVVASPATSQSKSNSSWEHLLLPQAASMPAPVPAAAAAQPATNALQQMTFQPFRPQQPQQQAVAAPAPVSPAAPVSPPQPIAAPAPQPAAAQPALHAPTPFVTKFNTPNPLAHLMAAPAVAPAPAMALPTPATAVLAQQQQPSQAQQTPDLAAGFQQQAQPPQAAARIVTKPSYKVVPALELADEEISVEKLLSLEWSGIGPATTANGKKRGSFSALGEYSFPSLSPNSSLVDLAAIPTL